MASPVNDRYQRAPGGHVAGGRHWRGPFTTFSAGTVQGNTCTGGAISWAIRLVAASCVQANPAPAVAVGIVVHLSSANATQANASPAVPLNLQGGSFTGAAANCAQSNGTSAGAIFIPGQTDTPSDYRYQQRYLFQTAPIENEPSRWPAGTAGATPFRRSVWSPGATKVDSDWSWEATHGDYIDGNGVRYGATPALSAPLNSGANFTYSLNATAIVQQAFAGNRWLAMKWDCAPLTTRRIAGTFSATPPRIDVTYADGSQASLACRVTALSNTSTSTQGFDDPDYNLNPTILVEFERPTKTVSSATLVFKVTTVSGTNTTFRAWLLDPRINTSPTQTGIAIDQPLDAGLIAHPSVIVAHRYVDGTSVNDFVYDGVIGSLSNVDGMSHFDPAIFGEGPTDLSKYPHTLITAATANSTGHRWTAFPSLTELPETPYPPDDSEPFASVTVVDSSYTGQGFEPLAPGMGALKVHMRPGLDQDFQVIHDTSRVGERGTGMTARLYFGEPDFGNVDDIYVRSYFRFATADGLPFTDSITDRYNVHQTGTQTAPTEIGWLDKAGKNFVVPDHHCYPRGGFSGSSGGPFGWQARGRWYVVDEQQGGPLEGGMGWGFHAFDIQNNPEGNYPRNHNYGANTEVQNCGYGGMHVFYANRWYCQEIRHKLNTVLPYYPGFIDDGLIQFWIDGRLAITKNNIVMRQWPIWRGMNTCAHSTPFTLNQFAAIVASGFANGEGYVGAWVRHNRINSSSLRGYGAILSRFSATQAVIGLVRRESSNPQFVHLALTDPIAWADGDELRIEANGTAPTVLTVKKNGTALTLKWYTGKTSFPKPSGATDDPNAFQNPGSTALTSATSYADGTGGTVGTEQATCQFVGLFAHNNSLANGLRIDSWQGGDIGGASVSDAFAYTDGDLSAKNVVWGNYDASGLTVCPLIVRSGSVIADPQHRLDENNNMLSCRSIGARNLLFNFFHGGQTTNAENRYQFISGVVAATSYIGPMNTGSAPGSLPAWRQGQAVGEFRQIVGSALSNTPPTVNPNSKTLPPRMNNWNGYSIDTRSSTVWSAANGGHNDWHGNEVLKLRLEDDNPRWIEVLASDSNVPQPTDAPYYPSGRPCSIHSYQVQQVIERRNRAIRFGATAGATIGNTFPKVDGFDITVGVGVNGWDAPGTYADIPTPPAITAGLVSVKNPATEDVYLFVRNNIVWKWTETSNTWTQHNTQIPPKDFLECGAAFDSTRNRIFLLREAATGMRHTYDIATGTFTAQTLTGAAAAAVVGGAKAQGLVYVPEVDAYFTRFQAAGGTVYRIDGATFECTTFATTGGDSIPQGAVLLVGSNENIYYRWRYVPGLQGIVYFPHYSADAWFLRTH